MTQLERTRASVVMNINESHYSAIPWDKEGEGSRGVSGRSGPGRRWGCDYGDAVPGGGSAYGRRDWAPIRPVIVPLAGRLPLEQPDIPN